MEFLHRCKIASKTDEFPTVHMVSLFKTLQIVMDFIFLRAQYSASVSRKKNYCDKTFKINKQVGWKL